MKNLFHTHTNQIIDLSQADRVFAGKLVNIDNMKDWQWAVLVEIDHVHFAIATTGDNREAAVFHARAVGEDLGLVAGGESVTKLNSNKVTKVMK
jgi:hypothetical protein